VFRDIKEYTFQFSVPLFRVFKRQDSVCSVVDTSVHIMWLFRYFPSYLQGGSGAIFVQRYK
jgi:hypothetical protein